MKSPSNIILGLLVFLAETTTTTSTQWNFSSLTKISMDFVQTLFLVMLPWIFILILFNTFFSFFKR